VPSALRSKELSLPRSDPFHRLRDTRSAASGKCSLQHRPSGEPANILLLSHVEGFARHRTMMPSILFIDCLVDADAQSGYVRISNNDNNDDDSRAGLSRIEIYAHGLA